MKKICRNCKYLVQLHDTCTFVNTYLCLHDTCPGITFPDANYIKEERCEKFKDRLVRVPIVDVSFKNSYNNYAWSEYKKEIKEFKWTINLLRKRLKEVRLLCTKSLME